MTEELQSIDTSAIEQLQTIKQEQDVLQQRLDAMNTRTGQVSEVVYERVRADYLDQYQALEERARPLKTQARAEYARLSALNQRLAASLEEARLAKEELEFRNELGEFEEKEFKQRLAESESLVKECEKQVAEGEKLRARFVAAFHSEDELTAAGDEMSPPDEEVPGEEEEEGEPPQEEPAEQEEETQVNHGEQPPPAETGEEAPNATLLQPLPQEPMDGAGTQPLPVDQNAAPPPPPAAEAPVGMHSEAATAVLLPARMVQEDDGRVIPVQMPTTTIGRAPNNDIAIPDGTISRHHAKIELTEDGFVIMDLGSENGIFVNGERVTERLLATGDKVEVGPGTRCYTFLWE